MSYDWVGCLSATGSVREDAVVRLHELMVKATRHQVGRMPEAARLGAARRDEIVHSAADEATVAALSRLGSFEGRSRFTTWAYKFGILHAMSAVQRAAWRDRDVSLHELAEPADARFSSPDDYAQGRDLAGAVRRGLAEALTPHQRHVAVALLVDEVPVDVLAERLGTTRGALYKTLHDARKRLRSYLADQGYLASAVAEEVN